VQKFATLVSFTTLLITPTPTCVTCETVSYPEKDPLFTVNVPAGWEARHEHGAVKIVAQAEALFVLQHVENVKDDNTAAVALSDLANLQGKQFALEEMKVTSPTAATLMGDFKGFITEYTGKDKRGRDMSWQVLLFSPKDDDYYLVSCFWTKDDATKTATDRADTFKSLTAILGK
jgi:hypothetical protein